MNQRRRKAPLCPHRGPSKPAGPLPRVSARNSNKPAADRRVIEYTFSQRQHIFASNNEKQWQTNGHTCDQSRKHRAACPVPALACTFRSRAKTRPSAGPPKGSRHRADEVDPPEWGIGSNNASCRCCQHRQPPLDIVVTFSYAAQRWPPTVYLWYWAQRQLGPLQRRRTGKLYLFCNLPGKVLVDPMPALGGHCSV